MSEFARPHKAILWLFSFVPAVMMLSSFAFAGNGIDCGCSKTGSFVGPDMGAGVEISQDSISPHGKYRVTVTGTGPFDVQVRRVSDNALRYSTNLASGYWGFSPDDDRFLYHYDLSGVHNVVLIDLSVSPANQLWTTAVTTSSSRILFSPYGDYVLYAALTSPTHTLLNVIDAKTGTTALTSEFDFQVVGGAGDEWGMAGWGFSPDSSSRTFVYAFVTGASSVQWQMINLKTHTLILNISINSISSFWQFSPCGDVLGIVEQTSPSFIDVKLYNTANNHAALYSATLGIDDPIAFRTTASSHIVKVGTTDYIMSSNTADAICTIAPVSLKLNPRSLIGGLTSTGTVVLDNPAAAAGTIVTLSSDNTGAATVPPSFTIPVGDTSGTFTVQTSPVSLNEAAAISATAGGVTKRDTLTVVALGVQSFTLAYSAVSGGDSVSATVTLTGSPGPGGKFVTLTNSNDSVATVPAGILVPQGSTSKIFTIHTFPVMGLDSSIISASAGGVVIPRTLRILPFPAIRMEKDTVVGGTYGSVIASIPVPTPGRDVIIQLQSSVDSIAHPYSPGYIFAGQTSTNISVYTAGVATGVTVAITATNAPFPTSTTLHVVPANLVSFSAVPDLGCIVGDVNGFRKKFIAGNPIRFTMVLDGVVPPGGAHVNFTIDKPGVLTLLDSTDIPEYSSQRSVTCQSAGAISSPEQVILTASYRSVTLRDTVTLVSAPRYTFVSLLEATESFASPIDLNNRGEVLVSTITGCYIWRNGVRTACNCGRALNDSGWIAGTEYLSYGRGTAVLYKKDTTIYIPPLDSIYAHNIGTALNNRGDVAISSSAVSPPYGPTKFTIFHNGSLSDAGSLEPYSLNVADLNDSGAATGGVDGSGTGLPTPLPFIWNGGAPSLIALPTQVPNLLGIGRAINNGGTVVGSYFQNTGDPAYYHPSWFSAINGVVSLVAPLIPWDRAIALDINDDGVVVGVVGITDAYYSASAFVFKDGLTYDLNCLTTPPAGWTLSYATKINEAGEILGFSENPSGLPRAFLLKPETVTGVKYHPAPEKKLPTSYVLSQNYPNPFNPSTTISYTLPAQTHVKLTITNILGQEIARLIDDVQAPGYYTLRWDAKSVSSGIYICRIEAGTFVEVRKMLLMK